jgi:hypothetical protein
LPASISVLAGFFMLIVEHAVIALLMLSNGRLYSERDKKYILHPALRDFFLLFQPGFSGALSARY